jgi:transposase
MAKVKSSVVFKQYNQQQIFLLPPSLSDLIGEKHLVRVVNEVVESMDIGDLINLYQGGGTSAYHPRMLLKVLLYAYSVKIYTGRKIAKALSQDIHFMWLSAMSTPDFRTINHFRSSKAKHVIESLFKEMLEFLMEHSYIKLENYFCDGSTFGADGNKHKMVWKKSAQRYHTLAEEKCKELFKQIDALNQAEDQQYGANDLEERGTSCCVTKEAIQKRFGRLNEKACTAAGKQQRRKAASLKRKLEQTAAKIDKYAQQIHKADNRSGYNKTDEDASAMRMKNTEDVVPAYNVLAGCEDQFITGVSVHQSSNDGSCFKDHLEEISHQQPAQPSRIVADGVFGIEQNYELLQQQNIENYLKFPSFHLEEKKSFASKIFLRDNFGYDVLTDTYGCPNNELLEFKRSFYSTHPRTGYKSFIKEYECRQCSGCPFYDKCCKSVKGANRIIQVNENLEDHKQQARENLKNETGVQLRKQRNIEIESCFGDIKHNMGFRRFHLRGLKKVKTEITLVAMAHNLRKMCLKREKKAA